MLRAGRTTYLHQLQRERLWRGVERERLVHISFEDERLIGVTAERELRGLEDARGVYPQATRRLLVLDADAAPDDVPRGIEVLPAWQWLLGQRLASR